VARPLSVEDFSNLADFLLESAATVPSNHAGWDDAENARFRSAVNRVYYGLFIYLKFKVEPTRHAWTFPQRSVHRHLRLALQNVLQSTHPLVQAVKLLQRERGKADYELRHSLRLDEVEDLIDAATDALVEAQQLTPAQLAKVADELYDLDRLAYP
jgi:hypothetical protein